MTSNNVIVTHSNGSFTLTLFDHLLLRVCVETSHAHGYSISLKLLQCGPVKPLSASSGESKDGNKTLVQVRFHSNTNINIFQQFVHRGIIYFTITCTFLEDQYASECGLCVNTDCAK